MPDTALPPMPELTQANVQPDHILFERPGFLFRRMHQIHLALFAEECAVFDITPVQYSIMTVAAAQPNLDQVRLGLQVGVDRATLANVVARLESKNLIRRTPLSSDKRVKRVALTANGNAMLEKMRAPVERAHARTIATLDTGDQTALMTLLIRLVDAQNGYGRAPLHLR